MYTLFFVSKHSVVHKDPSCLRTVMTENAIYLEILHSMHFRHRYEDWIWFKLLQVVCTSDCDCLRNNLLHSHLPVCTMLSKQTETEEPAR